MLDVLTLVVLSICLSATLLTLYLQFRHFQPDQSRLLERVDLLEKGLERATRSVLEQSGQNRLELLAELRHQRTESQVSLSNSSDTTVNVVSQLGRMQESRLQNLSEQVRRLRESIENGQADLRNMVDKRLTRAETASSSKLEQIRQTVDETLQGTLERRLGESFQLVGQYLEQVLTGIGEMQTLARGVGDLKKVLTNVKTRGIWGEVVLGNLLAQILAPQQFEANVAVIETARERVEYAIRLPAGPDLQEIVYLPIDSKFPKEEFERLVQASRRGDRHSVAEAEKRLGNQFRAHARTIATKYLHPPKTTDFAIMFLPTEGLYGEAARRSDLLETLHREYRVLVSGPATLAALLNSLQMGFQTLAIQRRSAEVWEVLGSVKTEFGKLGGVLTKIRKKLDEASDTVEIAERRTRVMSRKLKSVESLPEPDTRKASSCDETLRV